MKNTSKLYGLVLSGGKSTRMGTDKGLLAYHGVPQRDFAYDLLNNLCDLTFLSIRSEQEVEINKEYKVIIDQNIYRGPLNGILSAHEAYPDVAWLVLACDLPLINKTSLKQLIQERDPKKVATAYATKESGLPEPLVAIWEPHGLESAIAYMENAQSSCPRKFLINSDVKLIHPKRDELLYNANSLTEYEFARSKVQK